MRLRLGEKSLDAIFNTDFLITDPSIVEIVELVIVLHRSCRLVSLGCRCGGNNVCRGWLILTTSAFTRNLLLGLALDLLPVVCLFLMTAILFYRGE